jgi:hypothetical protein
MFDHYKAEHFSYRIRLGISAGSPHLPYIFLTDLSKEWGLGGFVVEFYTKFITAKTISCYRILIQFTLNK